MTQNPYENQTPSTPQAPQFQGQGAPHQQPTMVQNSPQQLEGGKAAQMALLFGILGLFFVGIVFGPLAIVQAKKAEQNNVPATAGKVLGWVSTIWGILGLLWLVLMIIGFVTAGASGAFDY